MDFIKFLNSKDIAEHLQKINYKFSPEEAAYVVHEARNVPLSEKHKTYRELIARYPDHILEKRNGDFETQPFSRFLQELMRLETEYIEECKTASPNAAYIYSVYTKDQNGRLFWFKGGTREILYPTFEDCFRAACEEEAVKFRIEKRYFGGGEGGRTRTSARRDGSLRYRVGKRGGDHDRIRLVLGKSSHALPPRRYFAIYRRNFSSRR